MNPTLQYQLSFNPTIHFDSMVRVVYPEVLDWNRWLIDSTLPNSACIYIRCGSGSRVSISILSTDTSSKHVLPFESVLPAFVYEHCYSPFIVLSSSSWLSLVSTFLRTALVEGMFGRWNNVTYFPSYLSLSSFDTSFLLGMLHMVTLSIQYSI